MKKNRKNSLSALWVKLLSVSDIFVSHIFYHSLFTVILYSGEILKKYKISSFFNSRFIVHPSCITINSG